MPVNRVATELRPLGVQSGGEQQDYRRIREISLAAAASKGRGLDFRPLEGGSLRELFDVGLGYFNRLQVCRGSPAARARVRGARGEIGMQAFVGAFHRIAVPGHPRAGAATRSRPHVSCRKWRSAVGTSVRLAQSISFRWPFRQWGASSMSPMASMLFSLQGPSQTSGSAEVCTPRGKTRKRNGVQR